MSQVRKFQNGGKTPKNLKEYEENKIKVEQANKEAQEKADKDSILINGEKYSLSEAKSKLKSWQGNNLALNLIKDYGKRGRKNIDFDYQRFLGMLDNGDVEAIDFTADGGFNIRYKDNGQQAFTPADKYSSDYIARAIRNNLLSLSPNTVDKQVPEKIQLSWNPQEMLTKAIWGREIDPSAYGQMTEMQRTQDVIKTLENNRNRYLEYFTNPEAFNIDEEGIPFTSMDEYDSFLNNLKSIDDGLYKRKADGSYELDANGNKIYDSNSTSWSFLEQLKDRRMGKFWRDYILGANNPDLKSSGLSPEEIKAKEEDEAIRAANGLAPDQPLSFNIGDLNLTYTKDGLVDANGNPYTGYLDLRPYGTKNYPNLRSGYIINGKFIGDRSAAEKYSLENGYINQWQDLINAAKANFNQYEKFNKSLEAGNYNIYNYLSGLDSSLKPELDYRIEDFGNFIDNTDLMDENGNLLATVLNIYNPTYEAGVGEGYYSMPYVSYLLDKNKGTTRGKVEYDEYGRMNFIDDKGNVTHLFNGLPQGKGRTFNNKPEYNYSFRKILNDILSTNNKSLTGISSSRINPTSINPQSNTNTKYYFGLTPEEIQNLKSNNINKTELIQILKSKGYTDVQIISNLDKIMNTIRSYQVGGKILGSSISSDKSQASLDDVFKRDGVELSTADQLKLGALAGDLTGLIASFVPGVGNIVGATAGLGSTILSGIADAQDEDGFTWSDAGNAGLNLLFDVGSFIPGLGTVSKIAKATKSIKRFAPVLRGVLQSIGAGSAVLALNKIAEDKGEATLDDWRQLANGLTPLITGTRQRIAKQIYTNKLTPNTTSTKTNSVSDLKVQTKSGKSYIIKGNDLTPEEINTYNKGNSTQRNQFIKDKLKNNTDFKKDVEAKYGKKSTDEGFKQEELDNIINDELSGIKIPNKNRFKSAWENKSVKNLFNPNKINSKTTKEKVKLEDRIVSRELKPEVSQNYALGKYNWYQRASIKELAGTNPKTVEFTVKNDNDYGTTTYRTVVDPEKTNLFGTKGIKVFRRKNAPILNNQLALPAKGETTITDIDKEYNLFNKIERMRKGRLKNSQNRAAKKGEKELKEQQELAKNIVIAQAKKQAQNIKNQAIKDQDALYLKEKEELAKLGAKTQREIASKKKIQEVLEINKEIRERTNKELNKSINKENIKSKAKEKRKENKPKKKTSKDIGNIRRHELGGILKFQMGTSRTKSWIPYVGNDLNPVFSLDYYTTPIPYRHGVLPEVNVYGNKPKSKLNLDAINKTSNTIANEIENELNSNPLNVNFKAVEEFYKLPIMQQNKGIGVDTLSPVTLDPKLIENKIGLSTKSLNTKVQQRYPSEVRFGLPLRTITSIHSLLSKNRTNNKIFDIANKKLKPTILDTPKEIGYNIQGNEGVKRSFYNQASDLQYQGKSPITSDIDKQLAYNLDLSRVASNLRLQGDLANEQALAQSREKAFNIVANNQLRREQVAAQNKNSITNMKNLKAQLEMQKEAQKAQNYDTFLHDITEQITQRAAEKQAINNQIEGINLNLNNLQSELNSELEAKRLTDQLSKLDVNDPKYKDLYSKLQNIQLTRQQLAAEKAIKMLQLQPRLVF